MAEQLRIGFYGDSYVHRLESYVHGDMKLPGHIQFFGKGGMTAEGFDARLMRELSTFRPHYVFINVGGNDIKANSIPKDISRWIGEVIDQVYKCGVRRVFFVEIMERGNFRDVHLTKKSFNAQRKKINEQVRKLDNVGFVHMKVNFPKEYKKDKVHMNEAGYRKFTMKLRHVMASLKM